MCPREGFQFSGSTGLNISEPDVRFSIPALIPFYRSLLTKMFCRHNNYTVSARRLVGLLMNTISPVLLPDPSREVKKRAFVALHGVRILQNRPRRKPFLNICLRKRLKSLQSVR